MECEKCGAKIEKRPAWFNKKRICQSCYSDIAPRTKQRNATWRKKHGKPKRPPSRDWRKSKLKRGGGR